ncbi:hypothetical protein [Winogradskyella sediminis]|uniref:Uncharacterized protein n=1 Tax=Winogradskyella sediminis TaxID=1382466 RepID=A0A1H1R4D8_9FLAO|nr:hypothetical protein [Winogradskyella sediminis]SDS30445.1 hypothetical protein SAMN04489797_1311 [Winogradskyella sediminis]
MKKRMFSLLAVVMFASSLMSVSPALKAQEGDDICYEIAGNYVDYLIVYDEDMLFDDTFLLDMYLETLLDCQYAWDDL